jgi:ABC-type transporter Mla subunit MlaD
MGIPLEPDIETAMTELNALAEKAADSTTRRERKLTRAAQLDALQTENAELRSALKELSASVGRWATVIAELYHKVPGAKERIDRHLGKTP